MRFSVEWIDGGLNRAAEERATLCKLGIYIQGQNACRFIDYASSEETESLVVPAVHLAEGIATDWWIIFGGRDRDHGIRHYRTGFALPDLRFRTDGSTFEVMGRPFRSEIRTFVFSRTAERRCSEIPQNQNCLASYRKS